MYGASSSGKTPAFGAGMPRFESLRPSKIDCECKPDLERHDGRFKTGLTLME